MAKGQMHSNREKKKPKQDKNRKKRGEAPSPFAVKLGTSYVTQRQEALAGVASPRFKIRYLPRSARLIARISAQV
jgi:hypothetical protein